MSSNKYSPHYKNMQNYCLGCRKHAGNVGSKKVKMANEMIRQRSKANSMSDKSGFLKQKSKWLE